MSADRVYVGAVINGCDQFYQRESEVRDGTEYVAKPYFVLNRSEAITMSEAAGKMFVMRLRSMRVNSAWIEDARDGKRIEVPHESQQSSDEDKRVPMKASLDDQNYFAVRPANTTAGPRWFIRCIVPGRPGPDTIYSESILGALERAQDLNFLQYGERAPAPPPQAPPEPTNPTGAYRKRPGSI